MKKKMFLRGLLGFPLGISIGHIFSIALSLGWGQGQYLPCAPELVSIMGTESMAVLFQTVLCGVLGMTFGACSVIWEIEEWSIAKQTFIYFLITALVMMPIAYLNNWMPRSILGVSSYFGIFVIIFVAVWIVQYVILRKKIKQMNAKIDEK